MGRELKNTQQFNDPLCTSNSMVDRLSISWRRQIPYARKYE